MTTHANDDVKTRLARLEREPRRWRVAAGVGLGSVVVLVTLLSGCASTDMTAVRDPAAPPKVYRRVLVWVPLADLSWRTQAEQAFVGALMARGVEGIPAITVLLPTRTYTGEEAVAAVRAAKVDGVLIVSLRDAYSTQTYIPGSSTTTGSVSVLGNTAYYSGRTQQYGGFYVSKPRVHVDLKFIDMETDTMSWVASSVTRGNAYARFGTMLNSLVLETIEKMHEASLIP